MASVAVSVKVYLENVERFKQRRIKMPGIGAYKTTARNRRAKNRVDRPPLSSGKPLKF